MSYQFLIGILIATKCLGLVSACSLREYVEVDNYDVLVDFEKEDLQVLGYFYTQDECGTACSTARRRDTCQTYTWQEYCFECLWVCFFVPAVCENMGQCRGLSQPVDIDVKMSGSDEGKHSGSCPFPQKGTIYKRHGRPHRSTIIGPVLFLRNP